MDFIIFSSLFGAIFGLLTFSYDICCQWSQNLTKRVPQLPLHLQVPKTILEMAKKVIPKLHAHSHGAQCQTQFGLNYLKYSAQSNLEDPECWWAHINGVALSTQEMGKGSRLDLIDAHMAAWNWCKAVSFGEDFLYSHHKLLTLLFRTVISLTLQQGGQNAHRPQRCLYQAHRDILSQGH